MTEHPHRRRLPPAPVLPPPQTPGGYFGPAQMPAPGWPGQQVPQYPSSLPLPPPAYPPAARQPEGQATYQTHPYQRYQPATQVQPWPGHHQPGWGYGGWPQPPPPRRSPLVARVLLGLVGAAATVFFALIILGAALGAGDATERAGGIDHSPATPTNQNSPPGNSSNGNAVLVDNPLYDQGGLANGNCPAQDLGDASTPEQTRFYQSLMNCLNEEWAPPIESAGFTYSKPGLVVFDAPVSTPCGNATPLDGRTLAFYCPTDSVMYADVTQMRKFFGSIDVAYAVLIGHEFGHHVQFETGMLAAYNDTVYDSYEQRLILSRRVELQASCMGGLFLGAIADSFPVDAQRLGLLDRVAGSFGDKPDAPANQRDHGTGQSNHDWIIKAFNNNDIAVCNTFAAPASQVE